MIWNWKQRDQSWVKDLVNFTNNNKLLIWCQNNIYFGAFCQILDFLDQYSAFINRLWIKLYWKLQKRQNIKISEVLFWKSLKKSEQQWIKAWKFGKSIIKGYIKQFYSQLVCIKMLSLYLRGGLRYRVTLYTKHAQILLQR